MTEQAQLSTDRLDHRLEFETVFSDLSSRFINLPPWKVDAQWKLGLSYGYADLDKYELRGNTRMLLARLQWMY